MSIRTITDEKSSDGRVVTQVYAEAAFYDLSFSAEKEPMEFVAETPEVPMRYALLGTGWSLGNVTVSTKRTWQSTEKNALAILRTILYRIWLRVVSNCLKGQGRIG